MKNLTEGNIYKSFILFAIPIVISGILSQGFNVINSAIAGKYLGEAGRAAIGCTAGFVSFLSSFFWGYTSGVSLRTAMLFGAEDYDAIKRCYRSNLILICTVGVIVNLLCVIFINPIFTFLKVDPSISADAKSYFIIMVLSNTVLILPNFYTKFFQALGSSAYPLKISTLITVLGIALRIVSIVFLGMGVEGIALATAVSTVVGLVFYTRKASACFKELKITENVFYDPHEIRATLKLGAPSSLQQCVMYFASFIISPTVNALGKSATAAYSVAQQMYDVNAAIYQNSALTVSNYTAQSVGAKKYGNLKKGVRVGFIQGLAFLTPVLALSVIFARPICMLFFEEGYVGRSLDLSLLFVRVFLPFVFFNVINNLFHNFFRGVKAVNSVFVFTAIGSAARIVSTLLLADRFGMTGVYSGWAFSWVFEAILITCAYFSGFWKKKL